MATANPSSASAKARARPIRLAPPVTSAALGTASTGIAPVSSSCSGSAAGTAPPLLLSRPHLGARHLACRNAGSSGHRSAARGVGASSPTHCPARRLDGKAEIGLFEAADLVAQPCRLLEFEIRGSFAHALFEIGDHGLQIRPLVMSGFTLRQPEGQVIAFVDAFENVGDAAAHALGRDPMRRVVGLLLFAPV